MYLLSINFLMAISVESIYYLCVWENNCKYYGNLLKFELLVLSSKRICLKCSFSLKCFCLQITGNLVSGDFKQIRVYFSQITVSSGASTWGASTSQRFLPPPSSWARCLTSFTCFLLTWRWLHFLASGPCSGQSTVAEAKYRKSHTCLYIFLYF